MQTRDESSVCYQAMQTQEKNFLLLLKNNLIPLKSTTREKIKNIHVTDQNLSSYNINLTLAFLN